MRTLINALSHHFGSDELSTINDFVNSQFQRQSTVHNSSFSLFDIEDMDLCSKHILEFLHITSLSLSEFVDNCLIVPSIDSSQQTILAHVIVRPTLYLKLLSDVTTINYSIVKSTDLFECYTTDELPIHEIKSGERGSIIASFIGGSVKSTQQHFSCYLNQTEIEEIATLISEVLFPQVDALSLQEHEELLISAVFRRFISEPSFCSLKAEISSDLFKKLESIIHYCNGQYTKLAVNDAVYSSWGKVIAKKVVRYKVGLKPAHIPSLSVFKSKLQSLSSECKESLECDQVMTDWGVF